MGDAEQGGDDGDAMDDSPAPAPAAPAVATADTATLTALAEQYESEDGTAGEIGASSDDEDVDEGAPAENKNGGAARSKRKAATS